MKPKKKKPLTSKQKTDNRKAKLQAAAERDGFGTWSEAITAWANGEAVLIRQAIREKAEREQKGETK